MKNLGIVFLVIAAIMLAGCASAPAQVEEVIESEVTEKIINHQAKAYRGDTLPEWVGVVLDGQNAPLEAMYPNQAVFPSQSRGDDLDGLKYWANTFDVNGMVAAQLNTSFNSKAGGVVSGSPDDLKQAGETLMAVMVDADFVGLEKEAEYWILWESATGEKEYQYMVLYTMTNEMLNTNLDNILNAVPDGQREIVTPVIDKIKEEGMFN